VWITLFVELEVFFHLVIMLIIVKRLQMRRAKSLQSVDLFVSSFFLSNFSFFKCYYICGSAGGAAAQQN
jgi:hypothetical protein